LFQTILNKLRIVRPETKEPD